MTTSIRQQIEYIPVNDTIPTPDNPRRKPNPKSADIIELSESIKSLGLLQPVLVRPHPTKKGKFDLRAGERRWTASKLAGLETIPAIVRDLTDKEAREITVTENLQREDLHPLEEAAGIQMLLDDDWTHDQVAHQLGKSKQWVARRASITNLSDKWRKEILKEESYFQKWSASHFEAICIYPANIQDELLKSILDVKWQIKQWTGATLQELKGRLGNLMNLLRCAPWDLDDPAVVPNTPACLKCPKRSGCQPDLLDDEEPAPENGKVSKTDRCLDCQCWQSKMNGWLKSKYDELKEKYGEILLISNGNDRSSKFNAFQGEGFKILPSWEWTRCKKSHKGARPGLVVAGDNPGKVVFYCRESSSFSSSSAPPQKGSGPDGVKTMKERRDAKKKQRDKWAVGLLQTIIHTGNDDVKWDTENKIKIKLPDHDTLFRAIAVFGVGNHHYGKFEEFAGTDSNQAEEILQECLRHVLSDKLNCVYDVPLKSAQAVAEFYGIEFQLFLDQAKIEYPDPKSWEKMNEDGTPKTAAKKKAAKKTTKKADAKKHPINPRQKNDRSRLPSPRH